MALDLFGIQKGIKLLKDGTSAEAHVIYGTGLPGGDGGEQDAAPVGSVYMRNDVDAVNGLQLFYKKSTAGNSVADWEKVASKSYIDSAVQGISWRAPVKVIDQTAYANIAAAQTAANASNTVDGVAISSGDRVLFSNIGTGNDNIYVVSGSAGSWTFTEDANLASDGDAVLVQSGGMAETQWVYDGSAWQQFGSAGSSAELSAIRAFIGKSAAGSELPSYSSTFNVTNGGSLEAAIGELDTAVGIRNYTNTTNYPLNTDNGSVAADLEKLNLAIGNRDYTNTGSHPLSASDGEVVTASLEKLNVAVGSRVYTEQNNITNGQTLSASINAIDAKLGANTFTSSNYVNAANDVNQNIDQLDIRIKDVSDQTKETKTANVTTSTVCDSIPVAQSEYASWVVVVENRALTTNRYSTKLDALHDGTVADFSKYATLKRGPNINGLTITCDVSGGNLRLLVASTQAVDVSVRRIGYGVIN